MVNMSYYGGFLTEAFRFSVNFDQPDLLFNDNFITQLLFI